MPCPGVGTLRPIAGDGRKQSLLHKFLLSREARIFSAKKT